MHTYMYFKKKFIDKWMHLEKILVLQILLDFFLHCAEKADKELKFTYIAL